MSKISDLRLKCSEKHNDKNNKYLDMVSEICYSDKAYILWNSSAVNKNNDSNNKYLYSAFLEITQSAVTLLIHIK